MAIRVGDLYAIDLSEGLVKVFHHVQNDSSQLNSNVIRVFAERFLLAAIPPAEHFLEATVEFNAHTLCSLGLKMKCWKKIGHVKPTREVSGWFRDSGDYGNPSVVVSSDWWVWRVNEKSKRVGRLRGEYIVSEIGIVFSPPVIEERARSGRYNIVYPAHE
jgi:hypothetical protein